ALRKIDLSLLGESKRQERVRELAHAESQEGFDLQRGPLLRACLLKLKEEEAEEHVLLVTMHHIVSDGWSLGVMVRELTELYEAFSAGEASPLAELPIQYVDYAVWQRNWLQGEVLERQLQYWRRQLEGLETLDVPTDHPRPLVLSDRGAKQHFLL